MTLILSIVSQRVVMVVGDQRLSSGGKLIDDNSAKVGLLQTDDACALWGYTGLARCGDFVARRWIIDTLERVAEPDYEICSMLDRFTDVATETFSKRATFNGLADQAKRLTVFFAGYFVDGTPFEAVISNFEEVDSFPASTPWSEFRLSGGNVTSPGSSMVHTFGAYAALGEMDLKNLGDLVKTEPPFRAIGDKCVDIIHNASDSDKSLGTIGKSIMSGYLVWQGKGARPAVYSSYKADKPQNNIKLLDSVSVSKTGSLFVRDIMLTSDGKEPIYPRVGRNHKCPCGSGKKYKHCHEPR